MELDLNYILKTMETLINIQSPSGATKSAVDFVYKEFEKLGVDVYRTNKGAIYGVIQGENTEESILMTSHLDTLGAMVKEVLSNGRLRLTTIGGFAWGSVEGENAYIMTDSGKIYTGSLMPEKASVHIFGDAGTAERNEDSMEIRLDEDVTSAEETRELGIEVGDFVAFDPRFRITESGYIKSRHLDDKACVAIQLGICKYFKENNIIPKRTSYFYIADYEEIGHGLYHIPENCKEVMAIDIGTVGGKNTSSEKAVTIFAKDSGTPYDYGIKKRLVNLAKEKDIAYKVDLGLRYGSDATAAVKQGNDVRISCIGPGVDSTHHYERTHKDGIKNCAELVIAYLTTEN